MKKIQKIPRTIEERLDCAFTSADNIRAMEELDGIEAWQFLQQGFEDTIVQKIESILDLCSDPVKNRDDILVEKAIIQTLTKLLHTKNATINRKELLQREILRLMSVQTQKQRESA